MQQAKLWTVDEITNLIRTNRTTRERAILALYRRQTDDERASGTTRHLNSRGVNQQDAPTLVHLGRLLERGMRLIDLPEHDEWAKKRLPYYRRQLTRIANGER